MTSEVTLYYAPDNASLCVRLALLELGIPFETVLVDRASQMQRAPAYLALNPNGMIPTLLTPSGAIYETGAILLWLAQHSKDGFMPAQLLHGSALTWLFWLSNTLHPALRMWFYPEKYAPAEAVPALCDTTQRRLLGRFAHLEAHARWLDDSAPSALGCYLRPMVRWAKLYGPDQRWFDLSMYPKIASYVKTLEIRPAAVQAGLAEGLGETIFSNPALPNPPEGSAK
tara:strand:- start:7913 stop:8593 length:681 start_codon:yes stop_codon:yes gene_type:complete